MQQIADWLEKLGMSEYAQRFAENRIDFSVLPDLTDQDLEKLGVVLGDRRKMLRAIAALTGVPAALAPAAPVTTRVTLEPGASPGSATLSSCSRRTSASSSSIIARGCCSIASMRSRATAGRTSRR